MLSVELTNLANMLDSVGQLRNVSQQAKTWSARISDAIYETTVIITHLSMVFTSSDEVDIRLWITFSRTRQTVTAFIFFDGHLLIICFHEGFGGRYVMDDANVPVSSG